VFKDFNLTESHLSKSRTVEAAIFGCRRCQLLTKLTSHIKFHRIAAGAAGFAAAYYHFDCQTFTPYTAGSFIMT
jgi:hypothetical protein